jgi:ankyrin repeat protein
VATIRIFPLILYFIFLNYGQAVSSPNEELIKAASVGRVDIVQRLLEAGVDVNAKNERGWTPLMLAATIPFIRKEGDGYWNETVLVLLDAGANPYAKSKDGWTAALIALFRGDFELLQILAEADAVISAKDLRYVLRAGPTDWFAPIVAQGQVPPDLKTSRNILPGWVLSQAVLSGHPTNVHAVLKAGVDVNGMSYEGTALMEAARTGDAGMVQLMLDAGADVNAKDMFNRSALMVAIKAENAEIVSLLRKNGAKE